MPIEKRTSILSKELTDEGWVLILTDLDNENGEILNSDVVDSDVVKKLEKKEEKREEEKEEEEEL